MVGLNIGDNVLAYYMRLSVEDKDTKNTPDESDSIINQRALLRHYVCENSDLAEMKSVEFVDDGKSGMNYDRSAFKMLMNEVKKGTVKAIIVKDYCEIMGLNQKDLENKAFWLSPFFF